MKMASSAESSPGHANRCKTQLRYRVYAYTPLDIGRCCWRTCTS